jgi:hypothetical protein
MAPLVLMPPSSKQQDLTSLLLFLMSAVRHISMNSWQLLGRSTETCTASWTYYRRCAGLLELDIACTASCLGSASLALQKLFGCTCMAAV